MVFETNKDVLDWFEKQPRTLTPEFIDAIPWGRVKAHPLDTRFVPILYYMRDVEVLTDMYHRELLRTPTGRDPHIAKFMERWGVEEITHGQVIDRFLNEAGYESDETWQTQVHRAVSRFYRANTYLLTTLTNLIGRKFTATHMTFGAIHEMTTAQAYRRLMKLADHPVLSIILQAIIREESAHTHFYSSVARLELQKNEFAQKIARFVIENFWAPVGQGSLARSRTEYLVGILFSGRDGFELVDTTVTKRVQEFPGFSDISIINEELKKIVDARQPELQTA